jgi:hypothetical protein
VAIKSHVTAAVGITAKQTRARQQGKRNKCQKQNHFAKGGLRAHAEEDGCFVIRSDI